jgi:NAD(P) transhydrogenase subunit alpha
MIVGVPSETFPDERRVAVTPSVVPMLTKHGIELLIESGAGARAGFADADYQVQGARVVPDRDEVFRAAALVIQVRGLGSNPDRGRDDVDRMRSGQVIVGLLDPLGRPDAALQLAGAGTTSFALELLPRITRAQSMDVLSSMASISGYKAVLLAAGVVDKMWPLMMTAAGTIKPARVLVVGAGVAGLQAIATAHRLGAVVTSYDVRPAAREQVESLGAKFLELELGTENAEGAGGYAAAMDEAFYRRQREMMTVAVADSDVVITTAAVPGRRSPILITEEMVRGMRPGSVIVDLAAEGGGNCESTRLDEHVSVDGVTVLGPRNLASTLPSDASQMYARNIAAFLQNLVKDETIDIDRDDPIIGESLLTFDGEVVNERVRGILEASPATD